MSPEEKQKAVEELQALISEIEARRGPRPDPVVIQPGSQHAAAAFKAGCEDEYSNRMNYRFGGEW